jgi:threonine/homoserine efflux transporter RhtA
MLRELGFALFSTILPYGSLNYVKPKEIAPTSEGLLLLLDPILHSLWAALIFAQFVSPVQYLGAALIIIAAAVNLKTTK